MGKSNRKVKPPVSNKNRKTNDWINPSTLQLLKNIGIFSALSQLILYFYSYFIGGYPIMSFMFLDKYKLDDLRNGISQNKYYFDPQLLNVEGFASVASPPMVSIWQFYGVFAKSEFSLWVTLILTYLVFTIMIWFITKNIYATIFLATLHPILFTFLRGNPDMWVLILIGIAGISFIRGKYWLMAIAIGVMSALKFPYLLFGLIFLMKKDFKSFALQIVVTATAFLLPLNSRPWGTIDQIKVFNGIVANYYDDYVVENAGLLHNISFFGLEKPLLYLIHGSNLDSIRRVREVALNAITLHAIFIIVLSVILIAIPVYYELRNKSLNGKPFNRARDMELYLVFFLFLAVIQCLYPQVAAEYRLAQLVIVVALLFKVKSGFLENRTNLVTLVLIFLPKHFLVIGFPAAVANIVTISSFLTPPLLIILAFQIQIYLSKGSFYSPFISFLNLSKIRAKFSKR